LYVSEAKQHRRGKCWKLIIYGRKGAKTNTKKSFERFEVSGKIRAAKAFCVFEKFQVLYFSGGQNVARKAATKRLRTFLENDANTTRFLSSLSHTLTLQQKKIPERALQSG